MVTILCRNTTTPPAAFSEHILLSPGSRGSFPVPVQRTVALARRRTLTWPPAQPPHRSPHTADSSPLPFTPRTNSNHSTPYNGTLQRRSLETKTGAAAVVVKLPPSPNCTSRVATLHCCVHHHSDCHEVEVNMDRFLFAPLCYLRRGVLRVVLRVFHRQCQPTCQSVYHYCQSLAARYTPSQRT